MNTSTTPVTSTTPQTSSLNTESSNNPTTSERVSNRSNSPAETIYTLTFLCSLIAKPFDGNRNELYEFISNCENAFRFATRYQTEALMAFVISKITGNAKAQLRDKIITDWYYLKDLLLKIYADRKHYTQLMEELNTIKQNGNETVQYFYNRIDNLCTRILNSLTCQDEREKIGRVETIKELSLQRFILHSTPDISRFLRSKEPKTLSEAFNAALEEERALQISKSNFFNNKSKFCSNCKTKTHNTRDCFKKNSNNSRTGTVHLNSSQNHSPQHSANQNKICNYCKKPGHLIEECFKRKRNNEKRHPGNGFSNSNNNSSRNSVHLNQQTSENNVVSTDWE